MIYDIILIETVRLSLTCFLELIFNLIKEIMQFLNYI